MEKTINKLTVATRGDRAMVMTRTFNAARPLVYDAFTKPELVMRWLGVRPQWTFSKCEMDVRVGGKYRWVWRGPKGVEMGMGGTYREVVKPVRVVATEKFDEAWYPGEALDTTEFTEANGKTTVTMTVEYATREARDAVIQSPAAEGVADGYNALEAMLPEFAKERG